VGEERPEASVNGSLGLKWTAFMSKNIFAVNSAINLSSGYELGSMKFILE
jgi:hypothetical protein